MKMRTLALAAILASVQLSAQTYSEDFESYTAGDYIGVVSSAWNTWSDAPGGTEDAFVVDDNAHGGDNAIYVSSTSANGGPQDIVLEFGEIFDEGLFVMDMWLFIEEGKGAYFNFQGTETIGTTWALNMFLNQEGEFNFTDSNNEPLMGFSYPVGEWFKITYEINLTLNSWTVRLNDLAIGAFSNSTNQIASINVFPLNSADFGGNGQAGMWLDDITYELSDFEIAGLNGALNNVLPNASGIAGQTRDVSVVVNNYGLEEITSFDVTYSYDGNDETKNMTDLTMASIENMVIDFDNPITLVEGVNDLVISLSNVNGGDDDNAEDNSSTMTLNPVVPAAGKLVIGEEGTGTWCGWCPRGAVMLERMEENYHQFFQGIAVHNGDPMTIDGYDGPFSTIHMSGYPGAVVDRGATIDPLGFESGFLERIVVAPAATIAIAAEHDMDAGVMNVSATYTFTQDVDAQYRVACVIVEDGVTGTAAGYAQSNYYAGGDNGVMGGYENLAGTVPAADMVYDHVARSISPSFAGGPNLPATVASGAVYTYNFTFPVDMAWDTNNMHFVAMLIENNGTVNNGGRATHDEAMAETFVDGEVIVGLTDLGGPDTFAVYPNPATDQIFVQAEINGQATALVRSTSGAVVLEVQLRAGQPVSIAGLSPGLYSLEIQSAQGLQIGRFIKQ